MACIYRGEGEGGKEGKRKRESKAEIEEEGGGGGGGSTGRTEEEGGRREKKREIVGEGFKYMLNRSCTCTVHLRRLQ